ncbi:MAG TPA: NHL repeat-containing protein [Verrucomicrobiae bacterium]|nr:NHL repeat-containing protein [Verrucomicrobiae bacterium]
MKARASIIYYSLSGLVIAGATLLVCASASAQNLFVGCYGTQTITEIPASGANVVIAGGLNYPTGLAFDKKGNLFESDQFSGNIYEFAAGTWAQTTFQSSLNQPSNLVFDPAGNLLVNVVGDQILKFTPDGRESVFASGPNFSGTIGMAIDKDGGVFVGNINGGAADASYVIQITPGGKQSVYASGISYPSGMAVDSDGNLFVASGNGFGTITKVTPDGQQTIFASNLNQPAPLAFDQNGDLVVGDEGANQEPGDITVFAPNGTVLTVNTSVSKPTSLAFQGMRLPPHKTPTR